MIYASKNPKTLETNLNYDLNNLTQWLYSNRLSPNIDKTKLLIFHSKYNKKNYENIIIKLQGVRLEHSNPVKYLGVYIDHNLSWDLQVKELNKNLSRANGFFSKLRHYVPKTTLLSVYYALFYSHLTYVSFVWSSTSQKNLDIIFTLQKKSMRILNSVNYNVHTNPLFLENKILKFPDIIKSNQLLFITPFINNNLPEGLKNMIRFSNCIHNHSTRISQNGGLFIPQVTSTNYVIYSIRYMASFVWNEFSKVYPMTAKLQNFRSFKKKLNKYFLDTYQQKTTE